MTGLQDWFKVSLKFEHVSNNHQIAHCQQFNVVVKNTKSLPGLWYCCAQL